MWGHGGLPGQCVPTGLAYTYASLFGVVTEAEYPYSSGYYGHTDPCIFDARQTPVSVMTMGWETLPRNDMLATMNHLAHKVSMYFFSFLSLLQENMCVPLGTFGNFCGCI